MFSIARLRTSRYGRSDRHHGEVRPTKAVRAAVGSRSERSTRPRVVSSICSNRRTFSGLEALVADTSATRRSLRHSPGRGRQQSRQARGPSRGAAHRQRVWLATDCDREGQLIGQEILEHYDYRGQVAGDVHRAGPADLAGCIRSGETECRICWLYAAAVRADRPTRSASVTHPHRDRHPWTGRSTRHRRWPQ